MQMKRCDWSHLQVAEMFHGKDYVKKLQALPLIHLTRENIIDAMADDSSRIISQEWVTGLAAARMPWDEFTFLFEQPNDVHNSMLCHIRILDEVTFQIEYMVGSADSFINNPTPMVAATIKIVVSDHDSFFFEVSDIYAFDDPEYKGVSYSEISNVHKQIESKQESREWVANASRVAINQVTRFLKYLETSTYFPVEGYSVNNRGGKYSRPTLTKKAKAEPWRRMDLPTIRYMNSFPVDPSAIRESKGGTHASPKPHQRAGGRRTLSHERYKHHPLYMVEKAIPFSPSWIGDKESIVMGTEYRVLSKVDIEAKVKARAKRATVS